MHIKRITIFLILLIPIFSCTEKSSTTVVAPVTEARIEFLTGEVKINNTRAEIGAKIAHKAVVTTGENSICEIIFDDKNIIRVLDNSIFKLDFSKINKSINLEQGTVTNVLKNLAALPDADSFIIKTNTAVLGVRGTSFFVKADEETTYVCVCNGVVTLKDDKNTNTEVIKAKHHAGRLFTKKESGTVITPAPMLYHTDEDIERVAEKIGYKIDWNIIDE